MIAAVPVFDGLTNAGTISVASLNAIRISTWPSFFPTKVPVCALTSRISASDEVILR